MKISYWVPPMSHRRSQAGFTLIEMAIVVIIIGIVISIMAGVLPTLIRTGKIKQAQAILEKTDYALEGYISANGRCPCPDTDGDGRENRNDSGTADPSDDTCDNYVGDLPYLDLGLTSGNDNWDNPITYGVYDDYITTSTSTHCSRLSAFVAAAFDNAKLHTTTQGGDSTNQAYVIVSGGPKDLDGDSDFLDDMNADGDVEFEVPDRMITNVYDDLVRAASFSYLNGRHCTGGGGGGGTAPSGVENTDALCSDGVDNDADGRIDCHDQDCCGTGLTVCSECPPSDDVQVTETPDPFSGTTGDESFSHTFNATGGSGYYYWYVDSISPAISGLDTGDIRLTGTLSGTLNVCAGDYSVTVTAEDRYDATRTDNHTFTLTIENGTLAISPAPQGFDVDTREFSQEFSVSGDHVGDFIWSVNWQSPDPGGFQILSLNGTQARLEKIDTTTAGTFTFTLTATDSSCPDNTITSTSSYTLNISGDGVLLPIPEGLEATWRFDGCDTWSEGTYNVTNALGDATYNGDASGGVMQIGSGRICRAAGFDGSDDKIISPVLTGDDIMVFTDVVTLACWFKTPGGGGSHPRLIEFSDENGSYENSTAICYGPGDGQLRAWVTSEDGTRGGEVSFTGGYNDNQWHHVVYTYSAGNGGILYVDGTQVDAGTNNPTTDIHDAETFAIGGYFPSDTYGFAGLIDEVQVFSREYLPDEIDELYTASRTTCAGDCYANATGQWNMDEAAWTGALGEVSDESGNALHGSAQNGATTTGDGKVCRAGQFTAGTHGIEIPDNTLLDFDGHPWTVGFWYYMDEASTEAWNQVYVKGNGSRRNHAMWLRPGSGRIHFRVDPGNQGLDSSTALTQGAWHFITGIYEAETLSLYINGQPDQSATATMTAASANNDSLYIGQSPNYDTIQSRIDQFVLYDRALAHNEIAQLMNAEDTCPPDIVVITTEQLDPAVLGQDDYEFTPAATGGTTPYGWEIVSSDISGLAMDNTTTGHLCTGSGCTPAVSGEIDVCADTHYVTLRVEDAGGGFHEKEIPIMVSNSSLSVSPAPSLLTCDTATFSLSLTVSGNRIGNMAWNAINWQGSDPGGFEVVATGDNTATFRKTGSSFTGTYQFNLTAFDQSCPDNSVTTGYFTIQISGSGADTPYYAGLESQWFFDECGWDGTTGEISDSAQGSANDGTAVNGADTGPGKHCNAGYFDGVDDYADMGDILNDVLGTGSSAFTATAWIRPYSLTTDMTNHDTANCFLAKASDGDNDNLEIGVNPDGTLHVYIDTENSDAYADFGTAGDIVPGQWAFIAVAYDGNTVTVTINDSEYAITNVWNSGGELDDATGSPLTIGSTQHTDNYFHGKIDDVRIYDTALDTSRASTLYTLTRNCTGACYPESVIGTPVGDWRFDECLLDGTADEVTDSSGQGAHGTGFNMDADDTPARSTGLTCHCLAVNLGGTTDQYATLGSTAFNNLNDFSLCLWFRINALSSNLNTLFSGASAADANTMILALNSTADTFRTYLNGPQTGNFPIGTDLDDGLWHHLVWTRDIGSGAETIYIDGTPLSDTDGDADSSPLSVDPGGAILGQEQDNVGGGFVVNQIFQGFIDEVRLYNTVLSQSEVDLLHGFTRECEGGCYSAAAALWRMEESAWTTGAATVLDRIGGYDGTPFGSAAVDVTGGCTSGSFTNNDSFISISGLPVSLAAGDKTTVCLWMRWNGNNAEMPLGFASRYDLYLHNNRFGINTAGGDIYGVDITGGGIEDTWHHVAAIFTNNPATPDENQIYIDGVLQPSALLTGTVNSRAVSADLYLSGWDAGGSYKYDGLLDDVVLYTRGLSASEIYAVMQLSHSCE
ncbi:MAG: LamG-like jellyroll fold domain-containing protein [Thermodesulfobacteriota bacterium]|nr:LamG-like jellyroll fold domain-containing protein [Thermodesulfobacteriota bacterium]